jgi:error-prone DNA polymerase
MRRSKKRMEELMVKLRDGMTANKISPETQETIVQGISSFALYGFPESHAASFALLAYASAYFKVKYLAAFTCAMLNNQPMGFYTPAVLVKDAQRHLLKVRPINVQQSQAQCTVEQEADGKLTLRLGLNYVKGLRKECAEAIAAERNRSGPFMSSEDLSSRVPNLNRKELTQLARIGALNWIDGVAHRRDALWQTEQISRPVGPLLRAVSDAASSSPLREMTTEDRLVADYAGTGLTVGPHPMAYRRRELQRAGVLSSTDLHAAEDGTRVTSAGCVIARQRPGTALGFIFLSMEDETGIANVIIHPNLYEHNRAVVTRAKFLRVTGTLQNQDGVIHIRAERLEPLAVSAIQVSSHDFH